MRWRYTQTHATKEVCARGVERGKPLLVSRSHLERREEEEKITWGEKAQTVGNV